MDLKAWASSTGRYSKVETDGQLATTQNPAEKSRVLEVFQKVHAELDTNTAQPLDPPSCKAIKEKCQALMDKAMGEEGTWKRSFKSFFSNLFSFFFGGNVEKEFAAIQQELARRQSLTSTSPAPSSATASQAIVSAAEAGPKEPVLPTAQIFQALNRTNSWHTDSAIIAPLLQQLSERASTLSQQDVATLTSYKDSRDMPDALAESINAICVKATQEKGPDQSAPLVQSAISAIEHAELAGPLREFKMNIRSSYSIDLDGNSKLVVESAKSGQPANEYTIKIIADTRSDREVQLDQDQIRQIRRALSRRS